MPIKLPKLPDRTPIKVTLSLSPDLHQSVVDYAEFYRVAYGQSETEPVSEILPYIIQDYIEHDKDFSRAKRKKTESNIVTESQGTQSIRRSA